MTLRAYDIGCEPSPSDTGEVLIQDGWSTHLMFFAVSKERDGTGHLQNLGVAVVECMGCSVASLGYPNDEGRAEHPLLQIGTAAPRSSVIEVINSALAETIAQRQRASAIRIWGARAPSGPLSPKKHFIVLLKEKTFECVASELKLALFTETFEEAFEHVRRKLNEH